MCLVVEMAHCPAVLMLYNVTLTSMQWLCIGVNATLYKRHVPDEWKYIIVNKMEAVFQVYDRWNSTRRI